MTHFAIRHHFLCILRLVARNLMRPKCCCMGIGAFRTNFITNFHYRWLCSCAVAIVTTFHNWITQLLLIPNFLAGYFMRPLFVEAKNMHEIKYFIFSRRRVLNNHLSSYFPKPNKISLFSFEILIFFLKLPILGASISFQIVYVY